MREVIDESPVDDLVAVTGAHTAETLVDLIRAFLLDAPDDVELVLRAIADRDYARVEEGARLLKSAAMDLGALELHSTCDRLQSAGIQGDPGGIQELSAALRQDFEEAFGVLEDLLESYG